MSQRGRSATRPFPVQPPPFRDLQPSAPLTTGTEAQAMSRIRRILHPTDFSRSSSAAYKRAVDMAKGNRAELLLVHVMTPAGRPARGERLRRASGLRGRGECGARLGPEASRRADRQREAGRRPGQGTAARRRAARADRPGRPLQEGRPDRDRHARAHRLRQALPRQRGEPGPDRRALSRADGPGEIAAQQGGPTARSAACARRVAGRSEPCRFRSRERPVPLGHGRETACRCTCGRWDP
jgi:nucleotide-binding universal stress UspA family protein